MKIYCKKCKLYLGDIEGNIRKGIIFLCKKCEIQREALELKYKVKETKGDYSDIFNEIFKGDL